IDWSESEIVPWTQKLPLNVCAVSGLSFGSCSSTHASLASALNEKRIDTNVAKTTVIERRRIEPRRELNKRLQAKTSPGCDACFICSADVSLTKARHTPRLHFISVQRGYCPHFFELL